MPRGPRVNTSVRLSRAGIERLDEIAEQHRVDRADVIRAAIALATQAVNRDTLKQMIEAVR